MWFRTTNRVLNILRTNQLANCAKKSGIFRQIHIRTSINAMWGEKYDEYKPDLTAKDSNDRALEELDVTLLKPHPEWRDVAAGPIWPPNFHELMWGKWMRGLHYSEEKKNHDVDWEDYCERNGYSPEEYLLTTDFKELYKDQLIWKDYVRNFAGGVQPQRTRRKCIIKDEMATGSPCPLCRDEKILVTYNNLPLLHHFIDKETGLVYSNLRTGACRSKHTRLLQAVEMAKDFGYLPTEVGFVKYNMDDHQVDYPSL